MSTVEVLKRARETISKPERWTQGAYARDARGYPIGVGHSDAVCFCATGAIARGAPDPEARALAQMGVRIGRRPVEGLAAWNDAPERTHAEVLAAFDSAIKRLEK